SAETTDALAVLESTIGPGFAGPKAHYHAQMTDCFYVLEGVVTFVVDDRTVEASAGSFVLVPPGIVHTFANLSERPARLLNVFEPPGPEAYPRDLADTSAPPDPATMAQLASRHDFHAVDD